MQKILAEISAGELFDKITILEIKLERIKDSEKIKSVKKELDSLMETRNQHIVNNDLTLNKYVKDLKYINNTLWDIENNKRDCEKKKNFDDSFILLARNVYIFNDQRADIKLQINNYLGSNIKEIKSHVL